MECYVAGRPHNSNPRKNSRGVLRKNHGPPPHQVSGNDDKASRDFSAHREKIIVQFVDEGGGGWLFALFVLYVPTISLVLSSFSFIRKERKIVQTIRRFVLQKNVFKRLIIH